MYSNILIGLDILDLKGLKKEIFMKDKLLIVKRTGRRAGAKGFSLIEVLLAILIFSISLFALIPLLTTAASIDRENYLNVRARAMAADVLDSLMGDATPPFSNPSTVIDGGVTMTRSWNVNQVGNLDNIAATVQYTYNNQLKTFTLTSQKAR